MSGFSISCKKMRRLDMACKAKTSKKSETQKKSTSKKATSKKK
jgi:hypothetical protein